MHKHIYMGISAAMLLTASWAAAHADQVYRWVDKDGHVHYSETPPATTGVEAKKLDIAPPAPDSGTAQNQQDLAQFVQQKNAADQATEKQAEQDAQKKARVEKACDALRAQLQLLQQSGRVFTVDAQGNRAYVADQDRQQEQQQLQDEIAQHCSGGDGG